MVHIQRLTLLSTLLSTLLFTACQPVTMPAATAGHGDGAERAAAEAHAVHWGYGGEGGPAHWGELNPDYTACADGSAQSPVNLTAAIGEDLPDIVFNYGESHLNILNNGHTV